MVLTNLNVTITMVTSVCVRKEKEREKAATFLVPVTVGLASGTEHPYYGPLFLAQTGAFINRNHPFVAWWTF